VYHLQVPVCIYSGMEQSFVPGDFNSDIVKQAKGLEWIGTCPGALAHCFSHTHTHTHDTSDCRSRAQVS
jgi:hypothetical protein